MREKQRRRNFRHSSIAKYWRQYEAEHGRLPWRSWIDWGEVNCWACGYAWPPEGAECKYWQQQQDCKHKDCIVHWDAWKLEKCHIVPLHMGGEDHEANIVLMCSRCHDLQPDSTDPEVTFTFMQSRPDMHVAMVKAAVDAILKSHGEMSFDEMVPLVSDFIGGRSR